MTAPAEEGTFVQAMAMPVVERLFGCDWGRRIAIHGLSPAPCVLTATQRYVVHADVDGPLLIQVCDQHAKSLERNTQPFPKPRIQNPEPPVIDPEYPDPRLPVNAEPPTATIGDRPVLPDMQQTARDIAVEQVAIALKRAQEPSIGGLGMRARREIAATTLDTLRRIAPANAAAAIGLPKPPKVHDYSGLTPYTAPYAKPPAIIVDLDGTVCLRGNRSPYDYSLVASDQPNGAVLDAVHSMAVCGYAVIFLSGRPDTCRPATEAWIERYYGRRYEALHMRAADDKRTDWIVKEELFTAHIRDHYKVAAAFDDRNQVVGMWRAIGLPVFQVAEGDF